MYVDSNISETHHNFRYKHLGIGLPGNISFFFLQILHRSVILDEHNLILCIYVEIQSTLLRKFDSVVELVKSIKKWISKKI